MTEITLGYSDSEDRIWLARSEGQRFWLTRRLSSRWLGAMAGLLERSVPGGDIPNALPAIQRISLEHGEALSGTPEGRPALHFNKPGPAVPHGGVPTPPRLATRISCQADGPRCRLTLEAAGVASCFDLNRTDCHRLLAALATVAEQAGWRLPDLPAWLGHAAPEVETPTNGS